MSVPSNVTRAVTFYLISSGTRIKALEIAPPGENAPLLRIPRSFRSVCSYFIQAGSFYPRDAMLA